MNHIVQRMDDNEALFKRILDDGDFKDLLFDAYLREVYGTLRKEP
jgi:hypothetical protein